jgi:hypothetical protein
VLLLVYTAVVFEPWSETPSPMHAFGCGHWMLPMAMKASIWPGHVRKESEQRVHSCKSAGSGLRHLP